MMLEDQEFGEHHGRSERRMHLLGLTGAMLCAHPVRNVIIQLAGVL